MKATIMLSTQICDIWSNLSTIDKKQSRTIKFNVDLFTFLQIFCLFS